jgi:magnesium-transporting ATPase (P-type)
MAMTVQTDATRRPATAGQEWYSRSSEEVAEALGVGVAEGLPVDRAAELLSAYRPNALPEEKPTPDWRRFIDQYRSYMQIILVAAAVVSLLIKEWGTAVVLLALTVLNAVVGLRQEGKAESAMNALRSMMKATARVRRDGAESQMPAEDVALGFDRESPGLMARRPRPRSESVLTIGVIVTVGLAGLAITIGLLSMIKLGQTHFHSLPIGNSIAFTAFALCLIVAALECRSETETVLTTGSFDSKQMNWAMFGEFVLAVAVTQMDIFRRLLGTTQLNLREFGWALGGWKTSPVTSMPRSCPCAP